jgi:hypothetical protein
MKAYLPPVPIEEKRDTPATCRPGLVRTLAGSLLGSGSGAAVGGLFGAAIGAFSGIAISWMICCGYFGVWIAIVTGVVGFYFGASVGVAGGAWGGGLGPLLAAVLNREGLAGLFGTIAGAGGAALFGPFIVRTWIEHPLEDKAWFWPCCLFLGAMAGLIGARVGAVLIFTRRR